MRFSTLFCLCVGIVVFVACVPGYGEILLFSCQTLVDISPRELDGASLQELDYRIKISDDKEALLTFKKNLIKIAGDGMAYSFPSKVYVDYDTEKGSIRRYQVEFNPTVFDLLNPEFSKENPKVISQELETIVCNCDTQMKHRQWINPENSDFKWQEMDYAEYTEAELAFIAVDIYDKVKNITPNANSKVVKTSKSKNDSVPLIPQNFPNLQNIQNCFINCEQATAPDIKDILVEKNVEGKNVNIVLQTSPDNTHKLTFTQFDQFKLPKLVTKKDAISNITSILQLERVLEPDELPENLFATMGLIR
jgi:CYTH domain-containing protein